MLHLEVDLLAGALKLQADEARIVAQPVAPSAATFDATKKSFSLRPLAPPDYLALDAYSSASL